MTTKRKIRAQPGFGALLRHLLLMPTTDDPKSKHHLVPRRRTITACCSNTNMLQNMNMCSHHNLFAKKVEKHK